MPKSRKTFLVATAVAVIAIAGAFLVYVNFRHGETAQASSVPDLLSALPAGAPTLVYIDLAAVRASSFYQHRPDKGPIAVPDRNYAEFVSSTGFDFEKDLDRVAIATWPASPGKDPTPKRIVVIADGRFDRAKIREYAKQKGKVDHQQGREVFLFATDDRTSWNSITFLDDHRVGIVGGSSIAPLLAASAGNSTGNAANDPDPARERAARMNGAAAFMITRVPPIPDNSDLAVNRGKNELPLGGAASAQLLSLARSVQWVTLAAAPDGDNVRISLEGECTTPTDARQLQSALEVLRLFGRAALESPKTRDSMDPAAYALAESVLKSAEVTATAERTRILIELTPDILKLGGTRKTK
jgi:hypothetical protein